MQFELAKVKIVVGPIVCQPSENALLIREQIVADHIEALNVSLFWIKNATVAKKIFTIELQATVENISDDIAKNNAAIATNHGNIVEALQVSLFWVLD